MRTDAYLLGRQKDELTLNVPAQRSFVKPDLRAAFHAIGLFFLSKITTASEPKIWQTRDRAGQIFWCAYDPTTNQTSYFSSENEVRVWIDQRYYR